MSSDFIEDIQSNNFIRKVKMKKWLLVGTLTIFLGACGNNINKIQNIALLELGGTLGGAMVGGYVGSQLGGGFGQLLYMSTGLLIGGSAGYSASRQLVASDQSHYETSIKSALNTSPDGSIFHWNNPETGRTGIFRAVNTYHHSNGKKCRKYRASVVFDDGVFSAGGIACQMTNGTWTKFYDDFS